MMRVKAVAMDSKRQFFEMRYLLRILFLIS